MKLEPAAIFHAFLTQKKHPTSMKVDTTWVEQTLAVPQTV